jgi:peroxiredoxin
VLVIDVLESREDTQKYTERSQFTFPVLLDTDGAVATRYCPEGVQPDLKPEQVPIASNLIIDSDGTIRFYSLLDTMKFDAKLVSLKQRLVQLLSSATAGDR